MAMPIRIRFAAVAAVGAFGAALSVLGLALPAGACGGLVGENGTIKLERTSTLAAYHHGVERYVTSFQFSGEGKEVGSIVPLPDVPTKVERGGDWTLQRLEREIAPPDLRREAFAQADSASATGATVLLSTKIDALDITILKGGGTAVGEWATQHGFLLTPDAPKMLDFYARRSPIFMAARFDATRAARLGQTSGDGTPIMLTIPTDQPWVPLRILGLGLKASEQVVADVFLLTDHRPELLAGGPGLKLARSESASDLLLSDLRSDKGMRWIPSHMWFTYLPLSTNAGSLDYDLAASDHAGALPAVSDTGVAVPEAHPVLAVSDGWPVWPPVVGSAVGAVLLLALVTRSRRAPTGMLPA